MISVFYFSIQECSDFGGLSEEAACRGCIGHTRDGVGDLVEFSGSSVWFCGVGV